MSRGKFTAAEKRRHSALMRKAWANRKRAAKAAKPAKAKPSRAAIRDFTKAIQALFSA